VTIRGSVLGRLLVVAVLAVGLVGMHHLVAAACAGSAPAASSHSAVHETHTQPVIPMEHQRESPQSGVVGAAAMCLAVLLMLAGIGLPRVIGWLRRLAMRGWEPISTMGISRVLDPPDLDRLCLSRT
jgi:hypothetical protein